jgi:chromate transporter
MAWRFFVDSFEGIGIWQTALLISTSYLLLERFKVHPAFVIAGTLVYGGFVL